jgi:hypothetical protein
MQLRRKRAYDTAPSAEPANVYAAHGDEHNHPGVLEQASSELL